MAGDGFPSWGFPILSLFHLLVAIQQRVLTGSQARGTGQSFPAFGFRLLQGEGGMGRARQGWGARGEKHPCSPSEGLGGLGQGFLLGQRGWDFCCSLCRSRGWHLVEPELDKGN